MSIFHGITDSFAFSFAIFGNLFKTAKYLNGNSAHDSYETPNAPTPFLLNCNCFQLLCHKAVGTLSLKIESLFTSSTRAQTCAAPRRHMQSINSSQLKALFIMCISFISQGACYRPGPSPCNGMCDRHFHSLKSLYEVSPFLCTPPHATGRLTVDLISTLQRKFTAPSF